MTRIPLSTMLLASTLVAGQNAATADPKHNKVIFENDQVRVVVVSYGPSEKSAILDHTPAVAIALTDRKERMTAGNGRTRQINAKAGEILPIEGKFMVENLADKASEVLVVEFKTQEAMKAATSSLEALAKSRLPANEASAVALLRTLNTAELTFASTYKKGFTEGLNRMGAPPSGSGLNENHADLLAPWLAGLTEGGTDRVVTHNGYRLTYTPGPGGYGSIKTYTVVAQPVEYGVSGKRSFFTDQTTMIRATSQNRPANANDPPL